MIQKIIHFLILLNFLLFSCQNAEGQKQEEGAVIVPEISHFSMPKTPDSMEFAGEKIDLTDLDIRERLDKELHAIVYYHNLIIPYFKRSNRFLPEIEQLLKENNLPDDFKYLALIESGFENLTSPSGAQGFWQFMPTTGREYGMEINEYVDERNDISKSTPAAAKYLRKAYDTLGSWIDAAASYNRGVAGFKKDQKWQKTASYFDTYLNGETARYIFRMMAMKLIFENPKKYGYDLNTIELFEPYMTKEVQVNDEIKDLAIWAKQKGINYKILIRLNPWIKANRLPKRTGGYVLLLPSDDSQLRNIKN